MIRLFVLMAAYSLLSPLAAQNCRLDFDQALRAQGLLYKKVEQEAFYYKNELQAMRIKAAGKGIVGQFFRVDAQHWLFIHYPAAEYNAIYKSMDTTFIQPKSQDCLRPLAYLRDWPRSSDSLQQRQEMPLFSQDLNAHTSFYYVDGKLLASEQLLPSKGNDTLSLHDYAWLPPEGKHYPRRFYVRVDDQHFYGHQQPKPSIYESGLYQLDSSLRSFNSESIDFETGETQIVTRKFLALLPTGYWESDLDTLFEDWDRRYTAKGFYENTERQGWWMQLSDDGADFWLGYFQEDSLLQLHKGSEMSWGESGKGGCEFRAKSQRINNTEVRYELPTDLSSCLETEWYLSPQPVLQTDGSVVEGYVAWEGGLPEFAEAREKPRRVSAMKLKPNGKLLYWRGDEDKKYKGKWRLEAQPLAEGDNAATTSVRLILEEAYNAEEHFRIVWMQNGLLGLELLKIDK